MPSIPDKMKAVFYYSHSDIRVEEIDVPEISDEEMLVKISYCGLCTGEAMEWYMKRKAPLVMGHEPTGIVVKVGRNVKNYKPGDRVFVHHHVPCMVCHYCRKGEYVQCPKWKEYAIEPGGMAEYVKVREWALRFDTLKLPESLSLLDGTLIEPLACVVKSLKRANIKPGDTILVIGLGVMGQMHILLAPYFNAGIIIGSDFVEYRLKKALEFGAHYVINPERNSVEEFVKDITYGRGADVVIVGPGVAKVIGEALHYVAKGGTILLFTPTKPEDVLELSVFDIYMREIKLIPSYSSGPYETREALNYIKMGVVNGKKLITHIFSMEEIEKAFKLMLEARESLKIAIKIGEER